MRLVTLTLAMLGLLTVGTARAVTPDQPAGPAASGVTAVASEVTVTPVGWYGYAPGWRAYGYRPYVYAPRAYWYGPGVYNGNYPGVYAYPYAYPYPGYYYPNGFSFQYNGPRRSFSFAY